MMAPKERCKTPVGQKPPGGEKGGWRPVTQVESNKGLRTVWERSMPVGHDSKKPKRKT